MDLWVGRDGSTSLGSCAIITSQPNEMLSPIHARMPVIIAAKDYSEWLDHTASDLDGVQ